MDSSYFDNPPEENGSEDRYYDRVQTWKEHAAIKMAMKYPYPSDIPSREFRWRKFMAVLAHHAWWAVHNTVAHPLIGIAPCKPTFQFHDWTSMKLNHESEKMHG